MQDLVAAPYELRRGGAGGALADFVGETEGFGDGEEGEDREGGGAFEESMRGG